MNITINKENRTYSIERDDGTVVELTCNEVSLLVNFVGKEGLRQQINDRLDDAIENGDCDIGKYSGTREDFEQEIFERFEDEIDCGNSVDDDEIDDEISDLITFYELD